MPFGIVVLLHTLPGHRDEVIELLESMVPRTRQEEGCLAFTCYSADHDPDILWLHEVFVTQEYHDTVHESYAEVQQVLAELPAHLSEPWTILQGPEHFTLPAPQI